MIQTGKMNRGCKGFPAVRMDRQIPSDTALVEQSSAGRRTALGLILEKYEPLLITTVRRYLGPKLFDRDGEDVLQAVRLEVLRSLPRLRQKNRRVLAAWLKKVARTKALDWRKALRARRQNSSSLPISLDAPNAPQIEARGPSPSRLALTREAMERLRAAINALPPRYQEVARFICEKAPTARELAAFLGKDPEPARKFAARALAHLHVMMRTSRGK